MSSFSALTSGYDVFDKSAASDQHINLLRDYGIDSQGDVQVQDLKMLVDNSIPGNNQQSIAQLEGMFMNTIVSYQNDTGIMQSVNNLANSQSFVGHTMQNEKQRMILLRDSTYNNVYKSQQMYMMKKYDIQYNLFVSRLIQFTIFIIAIIALICAMCMDETILLPWIVGSGIIAVLAILYMITLLIMIRDMLNRRKDDWNKFYFAGKDTKTCGK